MRRPLRRLLLAAFLALPVLAGTYTVPVQPEQDVLWWHYYYYGADNGWDLTPGAGVGARYDFDSPPVYRNHWGSYLGFSLPSLGPGETVTSAMLFLDVVAFGKPEAWSYVAELRDLGNAVAGTFDGWGAGAVLLGINPSGPGWLGLDVTGAVQGAYSGARTFQAFNVHPWGAGIGSSGLTFVPAAVGGSGGPYLRIVSEGGQEPPPGVIPEPGTLTLFAAGVAVIAARRLRRR